MHWDSDQFSQQRTDEGWAVEIDGSEGKWVNWFANQDSVQEWLTYFERNAIHAFHAKEGCNQTIANSGLVTVWARSTSRDNEQKTRLCSPAPGGPEVKDMLPKHKAVCQLRDWKS